MVEVLSTVFRAAQEDCNVDTSNVNSKNRNDFSRRNDVNCDNRKDVLVNANRFSVQSLVRDRDLFQHKR
jgi:hypothetical protein